MLQRVWELNERCIPGANSTRTAFNTLFYTYPEFLRFIDEELTASGNDRISRQRYQWCKIANGCHARFTDMSQAKFRRFVTLLKALTTLFDILHFGAYEIHFWTQKIVWINNTQYHYKKLEVFVQPKVVFLQWQAILLTLIKKPNISCYLSA